MKYKLKETDEKYVRVYPINENPTKKELEDLEEYLEKVLPCNMFDEIFGTAEGYIYEYTDENNKNYEEYSLEELCYAIASSEEKLQPKDMYNWIIRFDFNGEHYEWCRWDFKDLLEAVARFNCEIEGYLSPSQRTLVDVARRLYDGNDNC